MIVRWVLSLLALAAALTWGWQQWHKPPPGLLLNNGAYLDWVDCWFEKPLLRPVHCGRLHTRLEPGQQPVSFALPVVKVSAWPWQREHAPVVYAAGGPGGATGLEGKWIDYWLSWVEQNAWRSDVIFYDQRGVGLSEPALDCPELRDVAIAKLDSEEPSELQYQAMAEAGQRCSKRLLDEGWQLSRFDSTQNAQDLLDLVSAMGLDAWQLYAVSYGTRLALHAMRAQPPGLQAVVLDSVYPPQVHGERADHWLLNRSLYLFLQSCQRLLSCEASEQRLQAALHDAMLHLRHNPVRMSLREPGSGRVLPVVLREDDLPWLIFESQYSWSNLELLPPAIEDLARGHVSPALRELLQESVDFLFDESLSSAVGHSVDCRDNGPYSEAEFAQQQRRYPLVAQIKDLDWRYGGCREWPVQPAPESQRVAVASTVPTLLLSGEFDPVTPPEWAELAARTLSASYPLTFAGIGHGVLDSDACAVDVVRGFFAEGADMQPPACLGIVH